MKALQPTTTKHEYKYTNGQYTYDQALTISHSFVSDKYLPLSLSISSREK